MAELVDHPGLDNFLEIQPAVQIETVINAQTVELLNDGQDGQPASIRTCGPDDVLDFVNPSTIIEDIGGLPFPAFADDAGYRKLVVQVRGSNAAAQAFYRRLGFRELTRTGTGLDQCIYMARSLSDLPPEGGSHAPV